MEGLKRHLSVTLDSKNEESKITEMKLFFVLHFLNAVYRFYSFGASVLGFTSIFPSPSTPDVEQRPGHGIRSTAALRLLSPQKLDQWRKHETCSTAAEYSLEQGLARCYACLQVP